MSDPAAFWRIVDRTWTPAEQAELSLQADRVDAGRLSLVAAFPWLFTAAELAQVRS